MPASKHMVVVEKRRLTSIPGTVDERKPEARRRGAENRPRDLRIRRDKACASSSSKDS